MMLDKHVPETILNFNFILFLQSLQFPVQGKAKGELCQHPEFTFEPNPTRTVEETPGMIPGTQSVKC
jgi:hypothetical protein